MQAKIVRKMSNEVIKKIKQTIKKYLEQGAAREASFHIMENGNKDSRLHRYKITSFPKEKAMRGGETSSPTLPLSVLRYNSFRISLGRPISDYAADPTDATSGFNGRIYVYGLDAGELIVENGAPAILLETTLNDIRNLYFCRGDAGGECDMEMIGARDNFVRDLDATVRHFYTDLLEKFLKSEDNTPIFQNIKKDTATYKNHILIHKEIVDFFDIENNALLQKKLDIIRIETEPFHYFIGEKFPGKLKKSQIEKNIAKFLEKTIDSDQESSGSVNGARVRFFIDKVRLLEFLFQEFLPIIVAGNDLSQIDMRGEKIVKWLKSGIVSGKNINLGKSKFRSYNPPKNEGEFYDFLTAPFPVIEAIVDKTKMPDSVGNFILMRRIEGGKRQLGPALVNVEKVFQKDCKAGKKGEIYNEIKKLKRDVVISDYYISQDYVSRKLYEEIMNDELYDKEDGKYYVNNISWFNAVEFCNRLSCKEGLPRCYIIDGETVTINHFAKGGYRLPTEAEWEHACKSGGGFADVVKKDEKSGDAAARLINYGTRSKNGLFHLADDTYEWCWDWFDEQYYENITNIENPKGNESPGLERVVRRRFASGGEQEFSKRDKIDPRRKCENVSFRVVRNYNWSAFNSSGGSAKTSGE